MASCANIKNEELFNQQKIQKEREIQLQKEREREIQFQKEREREREIQLQKERERELQLQKERELQLKKEKERMNERKKMELKTVDKVAQELLESRNQDELKEYLFGQLLLLNEKKKGDNEKEIIQNKINGAINQLDKDFLELRKCNTVVSRVLNKKIIENCNIDNRMKKIENEINKVKESLNYHAYMGDLYNEQLKNIKQNGNI